MIFELMQEWAQCRDALLPAIEMLHGTHTEDDVLTSILTNNMKLWRLNKTGLVTEFCQFPRLKAINVFLGGGDLKEAKMLREQVKNYGRKNGCERVTMVGRHAWNKALGNEGVIVGSYMYEVL